MAALALVHGESTNQEKSSHFPSPTNLSPTCSTSSLSRLFFASQRSTTGIFIQPIIVDTQLALTGLKVVEVTHNMTSCGFTA